MDTGHYNCRDYYISPHFAPTSITNDRVLLSRHESWQQLEQRSRSPVKPAFPFLQLPLELRQKVYGYLLPRTMDRKDVNPLASHARNFSAVQKRGARGMKLPQTTEPSAKTPSHVTWQPGNIRLLSVSRQVHDECAEMMYGSNTFLLFVTYSTITFRYSWLLKSGLSPTRRYTFLELLPRQYLALIKRVIVNIDHVDSYTGMIKFNVSGAGLTHGLRKQVQRLVNALQSFESTDMPSSSCHKRRLTKINIRVSNGNAVLDQIKSEIVRKREGRIRVVKDLEEMLEPFRDLRGVRSVQIDGAVTDEFSKILAAKMMSLDSVDAAVLARSARDLDVPSEPQMCVYGNDI